MQSRGNFSIQVGRDSYTRPPASQQHPAAAAPPAASHYGSLAPQPHVTQHGRPSFYPRSGAVAYQHAMTNVPHQGLPGPVASGGTSTAQTYLHHPRPQQISNQITHSYPIIEQKCLPWSKNAHQFPPPAPLQGQSASHQYPSHAPPPPTSHFSSSSVVLTPGGPSVIPMPGHSYRQSRAPVLTLTPPPPPPPPPPLPPIIPPSSPSPNIVLKKDENLNSKGLPEQNDNLAFKFPSSGELVDDTSVGSVVVVAAHSLTDTDIDMEDDITYPDEEKNNLLSVNSNNECGSMYREDYTGEKLQPLQHTGEQRLPEVFVPENLLSAEASEGNAKEGGFEIASDCNFTAVKASARAESGVTGSGQNGKSFDTSIMESPLRHENIDQSGKVGEGLGDIGLQSINDVSTKSDAEKGCDFGLDLARKSLSESMHLVPESLTVSSRNVTDAKKLAISTEKIKDSSDRGHKGDPNSSGISIARQSKDSSRNYDENIGPEEANANKPDLKSQELKLDEFGRLFREDVSDSETSDRSPHDSRRRKRRRRRRRKKESRDTEFGGDKLRQEKGQLPECFYFLQGKCYRGTNCRYSHHGPDKSERSRYKAVKHNWDAPVRNPDIQVATEKQIKDKGRELSQVMLGLREVKDEKGLPVDSSSQPPDKLYNLSGYPIPETPSGKHNYFIPGTAAKCSNNNPQVVDQLGKRTDDSLLSVSSSLVEALGSTPVSHHPADNANQDPTYQLYSVERYSTKPYSSQEVSSQSLKEQLPSIAFDHSQSSIPLPVLQDYSAKTPIDQNRLTPENYSTNEASVAYQYSQYPGPLKSLSSSLLPPPPPIPLPPPPCPTSVGHSIPQHLEQSLLPLRNGMSSYKSMKNQPTETHIRSQTGEYQAYPSAQEPYQMLHRSDDFGSSSLHLNNLTSREGVPLMMGEDRLAGDPVLQGRTSSKSFAQAQANPLSRQSPIKGMYSLLGVGPSSDSNSTHGHSYFRLASYEPGTVSSSASRITQNFLERNRPDIHGLFRSKLSDSFNPYASTFDLPLSSKFSSNTLVRENDATTTYGTSVASRSGLVDLHRITSVGSKNTTSSSFALPAERVSRLVGNQYDPLFDSFDQFSNPFSKADHRNHKITGDSDYLLRFHQPGRFLNAEAVKKEVETTVSSDYSLGKEECGETIDQVKTLWKKKCKERSMKHFKISIAAFVKKVLKPSWQQGNMSREAFKTIVKKTVDKVSGSMESHLLPESQAEIDHYIDSSRGKLTKLVMVYVDKYVNM